MKKIVIALGGNALGSDPKNQLELLKEVSKIIVKLVGNDNKVILTHGNGPQVGQIALAMEYASNNISTPNMPFAECGSMSQGYIGYQLQQSIQNELKRRRIVKNCVSLITQVLVDENDEAFINPTKPIGMFYSLEEANKIKKEKHYQFSEDSGRGYRRVVPSPKPKKIVEEDLIKELIQYDNIIIAAGGGGIPVIKKDGFYHGVDAVIDKDRVAALIAKELDADILLILTTVDHVCLNYNKENQEEINILTKKEALKYIEEGQFSKGSMLPKIEACLDFINESDDKRAIIASLNKANDAINGKTGTVIKRR